MLADLLILSLSIFNCFVGGLGGTQIAFESHGERKKIRPTGFHAVELCFLLFNAKGWSLLFKKLINFKIKTLRETQLKGMPKLSRAKVKKGTIEERCSHEGVGCKMQVQNIA